MRSCGVRGEHYHGLPWEVTITRHIALILRYASSHAMRFNKGERIEKAR
jgi:hypothetical protein